MPQLIEFIDKIDADNYNRLGEKGLGIVKTYQTGLPVPIGFVISPEVYNSFIQANGIYERIVELCAQPKKDLDDFITVLGDPIRNLIYSTELQENLVNQIYNAYDELKGRMCKTDAVAVRSSVVSHEKQTFCYDVDTYLNIRKKERLIEAVKGCWASLWKDWAITQRENGGVSHLEVEIGIIVQEMVQAEFSGVLYTCNPVTHNSDEIVIDAILGLGEGASQGRTDSDNFIINKHSFSIQENLVDKTMMVIPNNDGEGQGTIDVTIDTEDASKSTLKRNHIHSLVNLGFKVDKLIGPCQQIEWAWDKDEPFILQVDPIKHAMI